MTTLFDANTDAVVLLDGGMGGELQRRTGSSSPLWSAQALLDEPDLVRQLHDDYICAGARAITTNTYSTVPSYLDKGGLAGRFAELAETAARIARDAADAAPREVLVLGSVPPLEESYRPDLVPDDQTAAQVYPALVEALAPHVDAFICETMSSVRESVNAAGAAAANARRLPVMISWTLDESDKATLRSGESIKTAVAAVDDANIAGFLFNCTTPQAITAGLQRLQQVTDKPTGAYPNLLHIPPGWTLDSEVAVGYQPITEAQFLAFADQWLDCGARLIGGCCGIGPSYIAALDKHLHTRGSNRD